MLFATVIRVAINYHLAFGRLAVTILFHNARHFFQILRNLDLVEVERTRIVGNDVVVVDHLFCCASYIGIFIDHVVARRVFIIIVFVVNLAVITNIRLILLFCRSI